MVVYFGCLPLHASDAMSLTPSKPLEAETPSKGAAEAADVQGVMADWAAHLCFLKIFNFKFFLILEVISAQDRTKSPCLVV